MSPEKIKSKNQETDVDVKMDRLIKRVKASEKNVKDKSLEAGLKSEAKLSKEKIGKASDSESGQPTEFEVESIVSKAESLEELSDALSGFQEVPTSDGNYMETKLMVVVINNILKVIKGTPEISSKIIYKLEKTFLRIFTKASGIRTKFFEIMEDMAQEIEDKENNKDNQPNPSENTDKIEDKDQGQGQEIQTDKNLEPELQYVDDLGEDIRNLELKEKELKRLEEEMNNLITSDPEEMMLKGLSSERRRIKFHESMVKSATKKFEDRSKEVEELRKKVGFEKELLEKTENLEKYKMALERAKTGAYTSEVDYYEGLVGQTSGDIKALKKKTKGGFWKGLFGMFRNK